MTGDEPVEVYCAVSSAKNPCDHCDGYSSKMYRFGDEHVGENICGNCFSRLASSYALIGLVQTGVLSVGCRA